MHRPCQLERIDISRYTEMLSEMWKFEFKRRKSWNDIKQVRHICRYLLYYWYSYGLDILSNFSNYTFCKKNIYTKAKIDVQYANEIYELAFNDGLL